MIKYRCYAKYNKDTFNTNLSQAFSESNILQTLAEQNVNSAMDELIKIIQTTINEIAPIREMKLKDKIKQIPWFTTELRNLIQDKKQ